MRNPEVSTASDYSLWDDADPEEAGVSLPAAPPEPFLFTVGSKGARRIDKWLAEQLGSYSRSRLQDWIAAGAVQVDGRVATMRQALYADQVVQVLPLARPAQDAFQPEAMVLDICYQDDTVLVLNKPAGLVVHPAAGNWSGTLLNGLLHHAPELQFVPRAGIVHRLDKDTTGLMVVALTAFAQTDLVRQLQARSVTREYLAIVSGEPPPSFTMTGAIGRDPRDRLKMAVLPEGAQGARAAFTQARVIKRGKLGQRPVALLSLRLGTGRTHQIRVHLSTAGFPIVGDQVYAPSHVRQLFTRQALHAGRLALTHPLRSDEVGWMALPPDDFSALAREGGLADGIDAF